MKHPFLVQSIEMKERLVRFLKTYRHDFVFIFILIFSFHVNLFGVGYGDSWFKNFQLDSALITQKTAECKGEYPYDGPIVPAKGHDYAETMMHEGCVVGDFAPYASQFGLQSRIVAFFAPVDNSRIQSYMEKVQFLLTVIFAVMLYLVVRKVRSLFNLKTAYILCVALALSPWLVVFARNTYWFAFIMFAPFVFSFLTYQFFKNTRKLIFFYAIIAVLLFVKFLNGYEHASTVALSVLAPVAFYELRSRKVKVLDLWRPAVAILGVSIVALGSAIFINIANLSGYMGSWGDASKAVLSRASDRATGIQAVQGNVILGFEATAPNIYGAIDKIHDIDHLKSGEGNGAVFAALSAVSYLSLPAISLPFVFREPIGEIIQSMAALLVLTVVALCRMKGEYKRSFVAAFVISLLGTLSWLILMPAHAFPHVHLNGIIFYMPLLIFCYVILGVTVSRWLAESKWFKKKK